jgi:hypothetical protein
MTQPVPGRAAAVRPRPATNPSPHRRVRHIVNRWLVATLALLGAGVVGAATPAIAQAGGGGLARAGRDQTVLTVRDGTLHWTRIPGVARYVIETVAARRRTTFRVLRSLAFTPGPVVRQTVLYRVRADVAGSPWSRTVSITYSQFNRPVQPSGGRAGSAQPVDVDAGAGGGESVSAQPSTGQDGAGGGQSVTTPPATSPPPTPPPPPSPKLKVGVMDLGNYNYAPFSSASLASAAGITYTREDVDRGQDTGTCNATDYVCTALRNGIAPLVLFEGYADANMTTELVDLARNLNNLAATYPIMNNMHVIEFGNEVWAGTSGPAENATTYGEQYDAAHEALALAGLGSWKLLADGDGLGTCVNAYTSPDWIDKVIAAQSTGADGIDGWTVHPYGPMTTDAGCGFAGQGYGWPEVVDYHNIAVAAGSTAPWYVTEVGQCLGGSGCNDPVPMGSATDMPEQNGSAPYFTQAADMRQYLTQAGGDVRTGTAAEYPWVAALIFYQAYDDGSGWFGLLSNGTNFGQPADFERPAFTELQQWIAANGEG